MRPLILPGGSLAQNVSNANDITPAAQAAPDEHWKNFLYQSPIVRSHFRHSRRAGLTSIEVHRFNGDMIA
jgi:hypothetical protein